MLLEETALPGVVETDDSLDDLLSTPYGPTVEMMRRLDGDLTILGVAGKMGLTMAAMAVRAMRAAGIDRKVYGVSRFSDASALSFLEQAGVEPLRADLLDRAQVARLPHTPNVIFMAGRKFGTQGEEALTWAMNALVPAHVCEQFAAAERTVAFSTGCVYPLVPVSEGGCDEDMPPAPVGEYAQSCLARERVFDYYSRRNNMPVCLLRLNYALDLRYGVLHDLATTIWQGHPVTRNVGFFNAIWQGDANNQALLALERARSPATPLNLTGPETHSVTQVALELGRRMDKPVTFADDVGSICYLMNASRTHARFGYPRVPFQRVLQWTADWVRRGGRSLGKPTHFEVSNGTF